MITYKFIKGKGLFKEVEDEPIPTEVKTKVNKNIRTVEITSVCRPFLWYANKVGRRYSAEERDTYFYVTFKRKAGQDYQKGGIIEKVDAKIIS